MEVSLEQHKVIKFNIYNTVFYFKWRCWCGFGEVAVIQANYQGCQFDVYFIQCQTSRDI